MALPFSIASYAAFEPIATGLLLYLLTKAPAHYRERWLAPLRHRGLPTDRLYSLVTPLKYLLTFGVLRKLHKALNRFADNYYHLKQQGEPWKFGDDKLSELILITGGCSGFGALMTKGFVGKARVVILDVQDLPEDLAQRTFQKADPHIPLTACLSPRGLLLQMRHHRHSRCQGHGRCYPRAAW